MWITLSWLALALVHTPPALAPFWPALRRRLYGADVCGDLGIMLAHRGVLFSAVAAVCLFAAFAPGARQAAAMVTAISLTGFLASYLLAGAPKGSLRPVALIDTLALAPLAVVLFDVLA